LKTDVAPQITPLVASIAEALTVLGARISLQEPTIGEDFVRRNLGKIFCVRIIQSATAPASPGLKLRTGSDISCFVLHRLDSAPRQNSSPHSADFNFRFYEIMIKWMRSQLVASAARISC